MTLFVLLFMIITTSAYIFPISSYGWIHQKVADSFGFGFGSTTLIRNPEIVTT
jgi:hypothetical protein